MERLALENPRSPQILEFTDHLELDGRGTTVERHSPWSNQGWLHWNVPVDTTSSDPRQCAGERGEVIPSLDEVAAWLEASLFDPSEGETEVPTHVGRWRQQKGPDEPQAAVEKERINEYQLQRDAIPTATPRAGAL